MSTWGLQSAGRYCPDCLEIYDCATPFCFSDGRPLESFHHLLGDKFLLIRPLDRGGMGTVYEAVQRSIGRRVAVKLLHPELSQCHEVVARFEREAAVASQVDHPSAIMIYDSGRTDEGELYIAMEYLDGETLSRRLDEGGPLPLAEALRLWVPVVQAIAAAHGAGVIHRDIKPDNVFLAWRHGPMGMEEHVKVLDFGIATSRNISTHLTREGALIGTLAYMAPEQLEGVEADTRSDVYALGLVLAEMLTGQLPWPEREPASWTFAMRRLSERPLPLRELRPGCEASAELERALEQMLARNPAVRPADARDLLRRLEGVPELAPVLAASAGSPPRGTWARRGARSTPGRLTPADPDLVAALPTRSYTPSLPGSARAGSGRSMPRAAGPLLAARTRSDALPHAEVRALPPEPEPPPSVCDAPVDCRRGLGLQTRLGTYAALFGLALLQPADRSMAELQASLAPASAAHAPAPQAPESASRAARAAGPERSLQVLFLPAGPRPTSIRCEGAAPARAVEAACSGEDRCRVLVTLLPGDRCEVRSPGRRSRWYDYEQLERADPRHLRGSVRVFSRR